jgi:hypothetical protein
MKRSLGIFHKKSATLLLPALLLADLVFIILHMGHSLTPYFANLQFNIEVDKGYAERYQYLKYLGIIFIFAGLCIKRRTLVFVPWALLFGYFLLDDGWQMHERLGAWIGEEISFTPPFGLRKVDMGELVVAITAGLILLPSFLLAYHFTSSSVKKIFHDLLILLALLLSFAIGVDMVHAAFTGSPRMELILGVIEDGGELIAVSLLAWYAYFLTHQPAAKENYLLYRFIYRSAAVRPR